MFSNKIIIVACLLSVTACAKRELIQERQRSHPPQSAQDVGTLLDGASTEEVNAILAANPEAQVRVLSEKHGLYEIFNVEEDKIRGETSARTSRNQFFTLHPETTGEQMDIFSTEAPVGLKVGNLDTCTGGGAAPNAVLTVEAPAAEFVTVQLGQTIRVNGLKSTAPAGDTAPVKTAFAVKFPAAAPAPQGVQNGTTLEFTPDTLGEHKVVVVAQGANGVCALDGIRFIVTANREYKGIMVPNLKADLTKFKHLALVHAQETWAIAKGDGVVIAVIDTGVNYNHPSLAPNIAVNKKEIPNNKIDDDMNGIVDDYIGIDLVNGDVYPYDDDSHGTHVAGLAAAKQFGLAPNAKILPIKALSSLGGDVGTIAAAVKYAVDRGANIVNLSLGNVGRAPHPAIVAAANYAEQKGVLLVIASGNGDPATGIGFDIDQISVWPAKLPNENIVSVAAFDSNNILSSYSNFGATSVDVVAPGGARNDPMVSCAYENTKGALLIGMNGTSMAAPVVSGIAADIWSKSPGLSLKDVKDVLLKAGPVIPELQRITVSGRHLDALAAVQAASVKNVLF